MAEMDLIQRFTEYLRSDYSSWIKLLFLYSEYIAGVYLDYEHYLLGP